jgi:hypothetical protein
LEKVIGADEVRVDRSGVAQVAVRLPWYRSLAPSTIENVAVCINGWDVPSGDLTVEINGTAGDLGSISERWQETWFVQDLALVRFPAPGALEATTDTSVSITLRIPYILTGPDSALSRTTTETRTLAVVLEDQP